MNSKHLAVAVLAAGVGMASPAMANWSWTGTLAQWGAAPNSTILDGDGDAAFRLYPSTTLPDGIGGYVTIEEIEVGGRDYYDVGVAWDRSTGFPSGYAGGAQLVYSIEVIGGSEKLTAAAFDTVVTGVGTSASALLYDLPSAAVFATLTSSNGARDPVSGYLNFAGRSIVGVQEIFAPSESGVFQDAHASFVSSVPEPGSLALLGLGVIALAALRRRQD